MNRSSLSPIAHLTSAVLLAVAAFLSFAGLMATASPAYARESTDYRCTGLADQARTAAASVAPDKARTAARRVATGVKLCAAGNEVAAGKQFRAALKLAGVAETETANRLATR